MGKREDKEKTAEKRSHQIKNILPGIKELITGKKDMSTENEYIKEFYASREYSTQPKHSKYTKTEKGIFLVLWLTILNIIILAIRYIVAYAYLQTTVVCNHPLYMIIAIATPFTAWVISTNENYWAFHQRKRRFFTACVINLFLVLYQAVYSIVAKTGILLMLKIPTNPLLTVKMVYLLGHIVTGALFLFLIWLTYIELEPLFVSETLKKQIALFKLQHIKDDRENREYKYDIRTIKNLDTGKPVTIKENDRFVQAEINGASGTGKTSTIFEGVIREDLDQKVKNRIKRQEALLQMLTKKQAYIQGPLREFEESAIMPAGGTKSEIDHNRKKIEKIRAKYPDCGMTIVAPNNSMIEDIIKMCDARDIFVNVLDPMKEYVNYDNARTKSINPFHIPLDLPEDKRVILISEASTVFSDVLIATNQMGGASDVYFTDISLSVSSNISAVVMLAKNIRGQQAYIDDVQECISNFENLRPYVETIEKELDISVEVSNAAGSYGSTRERITEMFVKGNLPPKQKAEARKNPYYYQLLFVKQELLGAGAEDMFSQARGLRNLINKIMADPRIKRKLSGDESRIDFDKILSNNEITVVNTAIELGKNTSTSFGLFFLLLHRASVLRRPKETRTPHFLWVDECAQYVHPFFDDVIALYRQYRVAAVLTLQTLTQLEKSSATAYLKNVFLGAGTHIVFGRLAPEEMKLYSSMAGINREVEEQYTRSESPLFVEKPTYSESTRTAMALTNVMEGADMRMLDFLELTIFTINNGRVLPGQFGRVFFVGQDAFDKVISPTILWEKVAPEAFKTVKEEPVREEEPKKEPETVAEKPKKEEEEVKKEEVNLSFNDQIPKNMTEEILTQSEPKVKKITQTEEKPLSLNDLYASLMYTNTSTEEDAEEEDIDYATLNKAFNQKKRS